MRTILLALAMCISAIFLLGCATGEDGAVPSVTSTAEENKDAKGLGETGALNPSPEGSGGPSGGASPMKGPSND